MRGRRRQHNAEDTTELLTRTREGDVDAPDELFVRYRRFARTVARRAQAPDVDDAVSEAFRKTLSAIANGHGPSSAFGPYVATAVRSVVADQQRTASAIKLTGDDFDRIEDSTVEFGDTDPHIAAAFSSLPERWRTVLWYVDVEGFPPREVAKMLDLSTSNAASALRVRARLALRAAYLVQLAEEGHTPEVRAHLNAIIEGRPSDDALDRAVAWHLEECAECSDVARTITRLSDDKVSPLFAPALLASFGIGHSSPAPTATTAGVASSGSAVVTSSGLAAVPGTVLLGGATAVVAIVGIVASAVFWTANTGDSSDIETQADVAPSSTTADLSVFGSLQTSTSVSAGPASSSAPSEEPVGSGPSAIPSESSSTTISGTDPATQLITTTSLPAGVATTAAPAPTDSVTTVQATTTTTQAPAATTAPLLPQPPPPAVGLSWVFTGDSTIVNVDTTGVTSGSIVFSTPVSILQAQRASCDEPTVCSFDGLEITDEVVIVAQSTAETLTVSVYGVDGELLERQSA